MIHHEDIQMPLMKQGMTHGVIKKWLVKNGDRIDIGEALFEMESEQNFYTVESFDFGTITLTGEENIPYKIGSKIGIIEFTERERIQYEHFALGLTYDMRQRIDQQRGELTNREWLQKMFKEFVQTKLK